MKPLIITTILLLSTFSVFAQNCDPGKFRKLEILTRKEVVTDSEFTKALALVKSLEKNDCVDYVKKRNGEEYIESGRTSLFGDICLKNNSLNAVQEYINYIKRHSGSAEEQISFSFEKLFAKQPGYVLSIVGYNKDLLNLLEWGFVNNHGLTSKNYKIVFFSINSELKIIYPKYKKAIDYLLREIGEDVKDWESNKKGK
jgi:hypothetical protein